MFPTHEVMGTLRPVDSYVAELIIALRKALEVAQNMTQMEALRQKWYDRKTTYWTHQDHAVMELNVVHE